MNIRPSDWKGKAWPMNKKINETHARQEIKELKNRQSSFQANKSFLHSRLKFNLKPGDRLGVTGPNGSGKTTLLRTVAGIYTPASGTVYIKGRISSLLDVSFGLDPEATGLKNIRMRGVLMGLSLKKIKSLEDEIADFTALGKFINLPVRSYSSGMNMRLGFAVSTAIPSDILLLDEWLSVGDADFSKKAEIRLNNMVKKSEIVIIASHDQNLIKKNCNQFLKLEY